MKGEIPLSEDLQHLRNMIAKAKSDVSIRVLRDEIKSAADEAPAADIIRIAQAILQCGIDNERGRWATRN
ncbi:MAG: hypothetical protein H0T51_00875 [Pirellulales bacterium]|nr:hypothetical protein [Pirellulales bacterium]